MPKYYAPIGYLRSTALFAATLLGSASWAADWNISRQLAVEETYSDNLFLDDTDKKSDFFTDINPGIVISGKGRRLTLDLAYSLQYLHYLSVSTEDKLNHQLQANANSELYLNHLFFDANTTIGQDLIDPLGSASGDATSPSDNLQTIYTYSLAPNYKNRFGRFAELTVRLENNGVFYSQEGDDSIGYLGQFELLSGSSFNKVPWKLTAESEHIEYEQTEGTRFSKIEGGIGYKFGNRLRVDTAGIYDNNDYGSTGQTGGFGWATSVTWTPSSRTSLQLGIGRRYFGWTPLLEFTHRHKHSIWTASFIRDISSARRERTESTVFAFQDAFGEPTVPTTGDTPILVGGATPTAATFISNEFQTSYTVQTRRSMLGISLGYLLRDNQGSTQGQQTTTQASVSWTRRLTARTSTQMTLAWDRQDRQNEADDSASDKRESLTFEAGLSRTLSPRTSTDIQYTFRNDGDSTENRIMLGLRMAWSD